MRKVNGFPIEILFEGLQPGSMVRIADESYNNVTDALQTYEPAAEWQLAVWPDPIDHPEDKSANAVYILRTEGLSPAEIEEKRKTTINQKARPLIGMAMLFAPVRDGWKWNGRGGKRETRQRWEFMQIGEQHIMRSPIRDVRRCLGNAMVARGLPWEFTITRVAGAEERTGMPTPVWRITRVK